jgi:zinc protease
MSKISFILLFFITVSCSSQKTMNQQEQLNLNFQVEKITLTNGLRVLLVKRNKLPIFSFQTYYGVGSKFEMPGTTGSSHLLEHMMFKGAKKYGAGKFDKLIEGNGGSNNAYTTQDQTVYYENLPKEHLKTIIDIEADRMNNLLLEKNSFEKERQVVLEERKMRYENSDYGKMQMAMMKAIYKGSAYGSSVIGEIEDLKTVSREEVQTYFKQFYTPNNAVIVIVGDIDVAQTKNWINEFYGPLNANKNLNKMKNEILAKRGTLFSGKFPVIEDIHGTAPAPMFWKGFQAKKLGERDAYVLDLLASILSDGESSYLMQKLVLTKNPIMSKVSAFNYTLEDQGIFLMTGTFLSTDHEKNNVKKISQILQTACGEAINEKNVQKVKNQYLIGMYKSLDTNEGIASFLGLRESFMNDYQFYKKEMEIYNSINTNEIEDVCEKYLKDEKSVLITSGKRN